MEMHTFAQQVFAAQPFSQFIGARLESVTPQSATIARTTARSAGKRQAVCQCDILALRDGREVLCALFSKRSDVKYSSHVLSSYSYAYIYFFNE